MCQLNKTQRITRLNWNKWIEGFRKVSIKIRSTDIVFITRDHFEGITVKVVGHKIWRHLLKPSKKNLPEIQC